MISLLMEQDSKAGTAKEDSEDETLVLNVGGAVCFVITASTMLLLLYFFMSSWFVWVLIVLFCLGGIQVQNEKLQLFPLFSYRTKIHSYL